MFKNLLYLSTPSDRVFAINPETGEKRWEFDPRLDWTRNLGIVTSRGVASWSSSETSSPAKHAVADQPCEDRIFLGTLDGRLIALDAASGKVCMDFGDMGIVDLTQGVDYRKGDDYSVTSPPTVVGDVVVVGAGIEDNLRVDVELGDVRGFDVRTGKLLWTWEPIRWAKSQTLRTGAANTWGVIASDLEHGILYLPTSSSSPDYYGGSRPGDNKDADSIVALDAKTGHKLWAFQVVHHDIWDYDIAAEPLLFTFRGTTPAIAIATKMGLLFVFNRLTGEPLYPIHERPVPQSNVPGEVTSPTQPFADLPPLSPITLDINGSMGATPADDAACRERAAKLDYRGIYTPPSLEGALLFPSNVGGVNWGSAAFDPSSGILYANTNHVPYIMRLRKRSWFVRVHALLGATRRQQKISRMAVACGFIVLVAVVCIRKKGSLIWMAAAVLFLGFVYLASSDKVNRLLQSGRLSTEEVAEAQHFGQEFGLDDGAPYAIVRGPMNSTASTDRPCGPTPWGTTSAINLNTGKAEWQTPLGTKIPGVKTGTRNVGGPIVTAGGLVFTAASQDSYIRAFDSGSGEELWTQSIPVPAQATPMSYTVKGRQYIVLADGGHPTFGTATSDSVIAFALP